MYVDILKVLADKGPLKLTHVMYEANVNCSLLNEYLGFLVQEGIVEERNIRKRTIYTITQRGMTVLKQFGDLLHMLPIAEEEQRQAPPLL
jgi:predicted transcriptional regulator